jgi:hypothetical protein
VRSGVVASRAQARLGRRIADMETPRRQGIALRPVRSPAEQGSGAPVACRLACFAAVRQAGSPAGRDDKKSGRNQRPHTKTVRA